ncbi:response regulator transcription factor [Nocardioides sp. SYSU D00038]|uniref:response regulator transcription factor n=1 Tax=Nocardioides sp. SYSU D00038 TaxID=2812554 RepID=UPI0019681D92|nr:response regulator transcription factor [Nocardioides sp. SYSU D00038]
MQTGPLGVAVVGHQPVLTHGLSSMLAEHPDRVQEVKLPRAWMSLAAVDVALYDVLGLHRTCGDDLRHLVNETRAKVLVVTRDLRPDLRGQAMAMGADGWISMSAEPKELVDAIEAVASGELLDQAEDLDPLGQRAGLTAREVDILTLVTQGLSNQDIAAQLYLSVNSVKSYIRNAYQRIGVKTRPQAVAWCVTNGFPTTPVTVPLESRRPAAPTGYRAGARLG